MSHSINGIRKQIGISKKDRRIRTEAFESQLERSLREQDTKFKRLYSRVKKRVSLGIFSDRVKNCHLLLLSSFVLGLRLGGGRYISNELIFTLTLKVLKAI